MSLRTRLTLTVAAIVAVAVFGGAYAAQYSAKTRSATRPTSSSRSAPRSSRIRGPATSAAKPTHPDGGGANTGGADTGAPPRARHHGRAHRSDHEDEGPGRYFDYDAVQQTIDAAGR